MLVVDNTTRVRSCEDIADGRRAKIEVVVNPLNVAPTTLAIEPRYARALARALNRHANFIDPPKRRKR